MSETLFFKKTHALLNSVQKFIEIQCWLLLTFFIYLHIQLSSAIWRSRHRHLVISVGIGIGIGKNLFCLAKSLFLSFEVLYEESIHGGVLFKYTC